MASNWITNAMVWPQILLILCISFQHSFCDRITGCSNVRHAYGSDGFPRSDIPSNMVKGENLNVCRQGFTCCTPAVEKNLEILSKDKFDKAMAKKIQHISNIFVSRSAKFDTFFTELLDNSKRDLHDMFVRTYGLLYHQNAQVFADLFAQLRSYYKGSDINLEDVLDSFFVTLLQRMFKLLNVQYVVSDDYLECLTSKINQLEPFGDVPAKLSDQVKKSFIAARTFVQGLMMGRDVILAMAKVKPSASCERSVMKMLYCPYCRGDPYSKPCNNYCMNVMKGCLSYHADLNTEWNTYIHLLLKVADRLGGPFNIETVVDPIDVRISDGIMNFQENSQVVTEKVFQGCGQPPLDRSKRDARQEKSASYDDTSYTYNWKYQGQEHVRPTTAAGTSLDRLVRDIRQKIENADDFWQSLPDKICNDLAAPIMEENKCWNGMGFDRYIQEVVKDGTVHQANNPEVMVDVRKTSAIVNQQILNLKLINSKLQNAYIGLDVDFIDTDDNDFGYGSSGSGSGSGSGAGSIPDIGIDFSQPNYNPPVINTREPPRGYDKNNNDNQYGGGSSGSQSNHRLSNSNMVLLVLSSVAFVLCKQIYSAC